MINEKNNLDNSSAANGHADGEEKNKEQQPLPFHNPLNPDDKREITQEDLENEQQYKEALSERD